MQENLKMITKRLISQICYDIDKVCRDELYSGVIVSERDYVSNLTTHLRFPLGPLYKTKFGVAQTLPGKLEGIFGCDAIIIFKLYNGIKIGMFEAKLPRHSSLPNANWDSIYKSKKSKNYGKSRFSTQIEKQQKWSGSGIAFWEFFINESKPGNSINNFDSLGSSCVTHEHAHKLLKSLKKTSNVLWTNNDLNQLLSEKLNFGDIILNILLCNEGKLFPINNIVEVRSNNDRKVSIPVAGELNYLELRSAIENFLRENGIKSYISLDMTQISSGE